MKINRVWAMPSPWTFKIPPIADLVARYVGDGKGWVDPFAGTYSPAEFTNDINPDMPSTFHMEAVEFCKQLNGTKYEGVLFDPPYSLRQIKECYESLGKKPENYDWTLDASFSLVKNLLQSKIKVGGYTLCFGWNSNGLGINRGFKLIEMLLVAHGGHHNDTICTVEQKIQGNIL